MTCKRVVTESSTVSTFQKQFAQWGWLLLRVKKKRLKYIPHPSPMTFHLAESALPFRMLSIEEQLCWEEGFQSASHFVRWWIHLFIHCTLLHWGSCVQGHLHRLLNTSNFFKFLLKNADSADIVIYIYTHINTHIHTHTYMCVCKIKTSLQELGSMRKGKILITWKWELIPLKASTFHSSGSFLS